MKNTRFIRLTAAAGSIVAASALTLGSLQALSPTETLGAETRTADFQATFRADKKPLEVIGQWAESSYSANGPTTGVSSRYSTNPQTTQNSGSACAHGGNGAKCGDNNTRSGASVNLPAQRELEWTPSSWKALAAFYFTLDSTATTKVACRPDGSVEAFEPTWGIKYGNGTYWRNRGMQYLRWNDNKRIDSGERFSRLRSGQTFKFIQVSSNSADTKGEISITPRWGTNERTKEAWSELTITVLPFYQDNRSQTGGPWTYKLSSRCGLNMNDNTGSTRPSSAALAFGAELPEIAFGAELPEVEATEAPSEDVITELEAVTGLTRQDDLSFGTGEFEVEATRELTAEDIEHIQAVLDQAGSATGSEGQVEEVAWIRREANGLPTVTLALPGGGYTRVTPKIAAADESDTLTADDINDLANNINALNAVLTDLEAGAE